MACWLAFTGEVSGHLVLIELGIPEMMDISQISDRQVFFLVETIESKMAIAVIMD